METMDRSPWDSPSSSWYTEYSGIGDPDAKYSTISAPAAPTNPTAVLAFMEDHPRSGLCKIRWPYDARR